MVCLLVVKITNYVTFVYNIISISVPSGLCSNTISDINPTGRNHCHILHNEFYIYSLKQENNNFHGAVRE